MNDEFEKVCSTEPCPDDEPDTLGELTAARPDLFTTVGHDDPHGPYSFTVMDTEGNYRKPHPDELEAHLRVAQQATRVQNVHLAVRDVLTDALTRADYRHELGGLGAPDPSDREGMYRFLSNVLLHAHDRAYADLPDTSMGLRLRVAVVAPMWVPTALPWHRRNEGGYSANFEWVPLWEDPCADVWHLVALARVDDGNSLPPSVLLDNYQWVGAYPAPTPHAGMGPHEPCGGACA